ncbi:MAG: hypothetical protein WCP34_16785 [Pseudomonadota bacterium]
MSRKCSPLSSRELLERIGLTDETRKTLGEKSLENLDDSEDLDGDLGAALRERFRQFIKRDDFAPGDLVTWKPGLKNHRWPSPGRPAVVLEVLDIPVFDTEEDAGVTYFHEPLDLVLGLFHETGPHRGDFLSWHFDSRRFQPWIEEV